MTKLMSRILIATVIFSSLGACIKRAPVVADTAGKPSATTVSVKRVAIDTRFKNSVEDRTKAKLDPNSTCAVPGKTIVRIKGPIPIVPDSKKSMNHVKVVFADDFSLPNCNLRTGFFFGPHLYGADWNQKKRDDLGIPIEKVKFGGSGAYSPALARKIVNAAEELLQYGRYGSSSVCYEAVSIMLKNAGVMTEQNFVDWIDGRYSAHAYQFAEWGRNNPNLLRSVNLKLANYTAHTAPLGSIIVYDRGSCGLSSVSGHIEVVTKQGVEGAHFAFSNFPAVCGGAPVTVFIPVD